MEQFDMFLKEFGKLLLDEQHQNVAIDYLEAILKSSNISLTRPQISEFVTELRQQMVGSSPKKEFDDGNKIVQSINKHCNPRGIAESLLGELNKDIELSKKKGKLYAEASTSIYDYNTSMHFGTPIPISDSVWRGGILQKVVEENGYDRDAVLDVFCKMIKFYVNNEHINVGVSTTKIESSPVYRHTVMTTYWLSLKTRV